MRKIINGKLYDTDTAQYVADHDNGYLRTDAYWAEESLYRKKTGEFFLFCEGAPLSQYGETVGRDRTYGAYIRPLTIFEAQTWVKTNASVEVYVEIFGAVEE